MSAGKYEMISKDRSTTLIIRSVEEIYQQSVREVLKEEAKAKDITRTGILEEICTEHHGSAENILGASIHTKVLSLIKSSDKSVRVKVSVEVCKNLLLLF